MNPKELDFYSWYELGLISERSTYQYFEQWDIARHIIAAQIGGKGTLSSIAQEVMTLPQDKERKKQAIQPPSKEQQEQIRQKYARIREAKQLQQHNPS